jgi:hypothetical protein
VCSGEQRVSQVHTQCTLHKLALQQTRVHRGGGGQSEGSQVYSQAQIITSCSLWQESQLEQMCNETCAACDEWSIQHVPAASLYCKVVVLLDKRQSLASNLQHEAI